MGGGLFCACRLHREFAPRTQGNLTMTRFVSLAVFALMTVGVFGTDAAAQGFS